MRYVGVIVAIAAGVTPVSAGVSVFDRAVEHVLDCNLGLRSAGASTEAERGAIMMTTNLDDPELELSHQWGQRGIGNKWSVGISQPFDWPGLYGARKALAGRRTTVANLQFEVKKKALREEIREALIEYAYGCQLVKLRKEMLERSDSLSRLYMKGLELGEVSILDCDRMRVELVGARTRLSEAELAVMKTRSAISALAGGENVDEVLDGLGDESPFSGNPEALEAYLAAAETTPEMRLAAAEVAVSQTQLTVADRSRYPGFSLGYSHDYELGEHFNGVKLGVTLPVFSRRNGRTAARAEIVAANLTLEQLRQSNRSEIERLYSEALRLSADMEECSRIMGGDSENRRNAVRRLGIALQSGHITLMDYLMQSNLYAEASVAMIEVMKQRALTLARLKSYCESGDLTENVR